MYKFFGKRFLDFICSLFLLTALIPVFLIVLVVVFTEIRENPFFTQKRPGKNEKLFTMLKFKTMNNKLDADGQLLPDSERLTQVGRWIRKTSIDELPQLINVLNGNMSFIGPRPLLVRYLPYYSKVEATRHAVRPGITGLAQISGRNLLDWDQRLAMDVEYVKNLSLKTDFKIFCATFKKVVAGSDVVVIPNTQMIDLDELRK